MKRFAIIKQNYSSEYIVCEHYLLLTSYCLQIKRINIITSSFLYSGTCYKIKTTNFIKLMMANKIFHKI